MHVIVAYIRLPFLEIFSNFVHFCPNFQISFFWKIVCMSSLSRISPNNSYAYVLYFHNFISCMSAVMGSSGRDCVLIILFQLHGSKAGWVSMTRNLHIGKKNNFNKNLVQFLSNLSKIIPSQRTTDIIL